MSPEEQWLTKSLVAVGTSSSLYWNCSTVGGGRGNILLHARTNQGSGLICRWWRHTASVAANSIGGGSKGEKGSWRK